MELNIKELKDWQDGARRMLDREIEQMNEELEQKTNLMRFMDVMSELLTKIDRLNSELTEERALRQAAEVKLSGRGKAIGAEQAIGWSGAQIAARRYPEGHARLS